MDLPSVREVLVARHRADLAGLGTGTAVLAGGTWLFSEPQPTLTRLVDISQLGWAPIRVSDDGLTLAATCPLSTLVETAFPPHWSATALFEQCCAALVASWKIWPFATVGGNVCLSLPAGAIIGMLTALDATATVWARDGADYQVAVADIVTGPGSNILRPGDVLRRFRIGEDALRSRVAVRRAALTPTGRSGALVIGRLAPDGGFSLTVTASTTRPVQLRFPTPPHDAATLRDQIEDVATELWFDDPHGDPRWRRHITTILAEHIRAELMTP